ncbi:MAG: AI-2E family transporter [Acidimicrobiia bacterium]
MTSKTVNLARLRISIPMAIGIVLSIAVSLFLVRLFDNASRSIGWIVFSGCIALMLYPALNFLDKFVPRQIGVLVLVLFVIGMIAFPAYTVVDNVNRQTKNLEKSLPKRAHQLETSGRFAASFKKFEIEKKTRRALKSIPETLQGGDRKEQIKANADRAIAFIAGGVLMIFFLLYGNRLVTGALSVVSNKKQREDITNILKRAYAKTAQFGWSQIGLSIAAGVTTYLICRLYSIPAAGLLGVWVALWNVVPVFGVVLGSLPAVVLAGAQSMKLAITLLIFFLVYEIAESFMRHKLLGPKMLRLDSIVTIFVVFGGLELYGLGGALAGLVIASFVHALAGEIASTMPPNNS